VSFYVLVLIIQMTDRRNEVNTTPVSAEQTNEFREKYCKISYIWDPHIGFVSESELRYEPVTLG
jgi:hypothetical protein